MAIKKVWIEEGCITCGNSEVACPELFKIDIERGTAAVLECDDFVPIEAKIRRAAASCPVRVIKFSE